MRRATIVGLCLMAPFSMSAIGSATASAALPEFGRCIKETTSTFQYGEAACVAESAGGDSGQYAWEPGPGSKPTFTSKSARAAIDVPELKAEVTCAASKGVGTVTGTTTVGKVVITFEKCTFLGKKCTGGLKAKAGDIVTNDLDGPIGFVTKTPVSVGQDLAPEAPATLVAEFDCEGAAISIRGSVIGVDTGNVDVAPTTKSTLTFAEAGGAQDPENLEGSPKDTLEAEVSSGPWLGSTASFVASVVGKEKLEIKAETKPSPKWWVEGKLLTGSEPIAETTNVTEDFKQEMHGKDVGKFVVQCDEVKVKGGAIEGPSTRSEKAVVYENCEVVGKPECAVATTETEPLEAKLEGPPGAVTLKFKPKSGSRIAGWNVTQPGITPCKVKGFYEADGTMVCFYSNVETEKFNHPLEFTATSGSKVTVGGMPAKFTGTDEVHLASGENWSAW